MLQSSMATASTVSSRMAINQSSVQLSPTGSLHMLNSDTKRPILSLNSSYLQLPDLPALSANLTTTRLTTNSVSCLHISQLNLFSNLCAMHFTIQVRNLNGLQSSQQLFMRGAVGVNIMGQFVNVSASGVATLRAGVREREREM